MNKKRMLCLLLVLCAVALTLLLMVGVAALALGIPNSLFAMAAYRTKSGRAAVIALDQALKAWIRTAIPLDPAPAETAAAVQEAPEEEVKEEAKEEAVEVREFSPFTTIAMSSVA